MHSVHGMDDPPSGVDEKTMAFFPSQLCDHPNKPRIHVESDLPAKFIMNFTVPRHLVWQVQSIVYDDDLVRRHAACGKDASADRIRIYQYSMSQAIDKACTPIMNAPIRILQVALRGNDSYARGLRRDY